MKPTKRYIVIKRPLRKWRAAMHTFVTVVHAESAKDALKVALDIHPDWMQPDPKYYARISARELQAAELYAF